MTFNRTIVLTIAAAAMLGFALPACSQPAPGQQDSSQNASGQAASANTAPSGGRGYGRPVTLSEYQARFRDRIMQADTDHDNRVSLAEWSAYRAERVGQGGGGGRGGRDFGDPNRQFQVMDVNHDGYVTPAEIDAASAERFARMDANHDGVLTPDERRALRGGGTVGEPTQPLPPPQ